MKKLISLFLSLLLVFSLTGCSSGSEEDGFQLSLPGDRVYPSDGVAEGELESVMRTYFFDFSVTGATCDYSYGDYTAAQGNKLVLLEMTIKNTFDEEIPMFPTDFVLQWDDADGQTYSVHTLTGDGLLNGFYDLEEDESRSGLLIFEVPANEDSFTLYHQEYFDDETTGDEFFVFLTAELPEDLDAPENYGSICTADDGFGYGELGSVMRTYFFDFSVNDAQCTDSYNGYTAAEGAKLVVAEVTVFNSYYEEIPMYDVDFQIQWDDPAEDAYAFPLTGLDGEEILPEEYEVDSGESRTGILVFEVPAEADETAFSISYMEYYDNDSDGNIFFVYFSTTDTPAPFLTEEEPADL